MELQYTIVQHLDQDEQWLCQDLPAQQLKIYIRSYVLAKATIGLLTNNNEYVQWWYEISNIVHMNKHLPNN